MEDQLQQIKNDQAKRFALLTDLTNLQNELTKQKQYQERAILSGSDSSDYEAAIVRLEIKIRGIKSAIKTLDEGLKGLDEEKARQERQKKLVQMEKEKLECLAIASDIYLLLADVIGKINQLRDKYRNDYLPVARAVKQEHNFEMKISNLYHVLGKGIGELLPSFPREIFADGKLIKPDDMRRSLKK